jgi:hydrogenase maturation protease
VRILILGVGNVLLRDEGIGVAAVRYLQERYEWPENVELLDGGTQGLKLMPLIQECDFLLVLDAILGDGPPGALYRLKGDEVRNSLGFRDSTHQTDLVDTLACCRLAGHCPETLVIGMQPTEWRSLQPELTLESAARIPALCACAIEELQHRGVEIREVG